MSDVFADEVRALAVSFDDADWDDVRRRASTRESSVGSHGRFGTRGWAALAAALLVLVLIGTGVTLAATGVFRASPAPQEVVADFSAYATQLGYHPDSHRAQLVAADGELLLYATPSRERSFCVVTSTPWRRPGKTTGDGGVCVPPHRLSQPILASVTAASAADEDGLSTKVVVGRVLADGASTLRLTDPSGEIIERTLGAAGFFIVGVVDTGCPEESWSPTFTAYDTDGAVVAKSHITLVYVDPKRPDGGCGWENTPHGPYAFDR